MMSRVGSNSAAVLWLYDHIEACRLGAAQQCDEPSHRAR